MSSPTLSSAVEDDIFNTIKNKHNLVNAMMSIPRYSDPKQQSRDTLAHFFATATDDEMSIEAWALRSLKKYSDEAKQKEWNKHIVSRYAQAMGFSCHSSNANRATPNADRREGMADTLEEAVTVKMVYHLVRHNIDETRLVRQAVHETKPILVEIRDLLKTLVLASQPPPSDAENTAEIAPYNDDGVGAGLSTVTRDTAV